MRHRLLFLAAVLACAGAASGSARADGLPVLGIDVGSEGVAVGQARYVTMPAGGRTLLARVATRGGRILAFRFLPGKLTIPAVAYDGSASGLSANGRRLVLIEPRAAFPRARTTLAVVDTKGLWMERLVRLRGDFSFDAVSPDGRWAYLINYTSPGDPTRYDVRTLNVVTGRLDPRLVVDPRESGEKMRGNPITRAASRDGRWAYTLYDGAGATPFVHALDTSARTARCIDLDLLTGRQDLWRMRLSLSADGSTLAVGKAATIDLASFRVAAPKAVVPPRTGDRTWPWALGLGLVAVVAAWLVVRRRSGLRAGRTRLANTPRRI
jgi:LPXTG-motif cell wall-anchored protein